MTKRTILVAGGAGFIGSHLCEALLADGADVICLDNYCTGLRANIHHLEREPRFDLIEADVIEPLPAALGAVTHIYNLACPAAPPQFQANPEHVMLSNVVGTRNLLQLAEATRARFLLASTSEIYGDPEVHPQHESYRGSVNCTGPRACYNEGKRAAESLAFDYERYRRIDARIARIFNTYGPRMRPDDGRVVPNFICQALRGEDITIYGDGSQTRSYCYVSDLVDGLMRLMDCDAPLPGAINLGNPAEMAVRALVEVVLVATRSESNVVHLPLPEDDPRRRCPDIGRARALLGWEPRVDLKQGLAMSVTWFKASLAAAASERDETTLEIAAE